MAAPHDALFRRMMADPRIAAEWLSAKLPPEVAARIDFSSLELSPSSPVDEALHAFYSDLVYRARFVAAEGEAARDARLLLLIEHQSTSDEMMVFRLLQYVVMLWDGWRRDHPSAKRLPLIIPVVLHQGPQAWRAPTDLVDLLDLTDEERVVFGRYAPRLWYELDDLGHASDEDLRGRGMSASATLSLAALRDARESRDVLGLLSTWRDLIHEGLATEQGTRAVKTVLQYILEVHPSLDAQKLAERVESFTSDVGASVMATIGELMQTSHAEGELKGQRATLRRMLRLKFHAAATDAMLGRLDAADAATLERWEAQLLVATTIEEALR